MSWNREQSPEIFAAIDKAFEVPEILRPERIIATGFMGSRVYFAETVPVEDKIREISQQFGIPLQLIAAFKGKHFVSSIFPILLSLGQEFVDTMNFKTISLKMFLI